MKINFFVIFCIAFIFYLLGEFSFIVGDFVIPYYFIIGTAILLFLLIINFKFCINYLNLMLKTKPGKFLLFFTIWAFVTILVSLFQGTFVFGSFISNFLGNFFNSFLYPMLIMCLLICNINIDKKFKKFIFIVFFIVLILGIIQWVTINYDIESIKQIFSYLVNRNVYLTGKEKVAIMAFEKPRISTIFREPGEYAGFLIVSCPVFFYLSNLKEKLFSIRFVDIVLKYFLKILWFINMIMTQSPINLIFAILVGIGYLFLQRSKMIKFVKRYHYIFLSLLMTLVVVFSLSVLLSVKNNDIDIEKSYLSRISTTVKNITSINALVDAEPSLATRICTHEAQVRMGLHYPIFGVGYANTDSLWGQYVLNLPHNITLESYINAINKKQKGGSSFIWKILSETGFIGAFLLYTYWITLFQRGINIDKYYIEKDFTNALSYTLLIYICYSWYLMLAPIFLVYFGILFGIIIKCKYKSQSY